MTVMTVRPCSELGWDLAK